MKSAFPVYASGAADFDVLSLACFSVEGLWWKTGEFRPAVLSSQECSTAVKPPG